MAYSIVTKEKIKQKTGPKERTLEERFWSHVTPTDKHECWIWNGGTRNHTSYGQISLKPGKLMAAHRASFELHFRKLEPGEIVMRTCDNRSCVNPSHLYVGSRYDWAQKVHGIEVTDDYLAQRQRKAQERAKNFYWNDPEKRKREVRNYQMKKKIEAIEFLGGKCQKCGFNKHPAALQFHHRNPELKKFNITTKELSSPRKLDWKTEIIPELKKCDLLCANCHFIEECKWDINDK